MTQQNAAVIMDDHLLFKESFTLLLKSLSRFELVLQYSDEKQMWSSLSTIPLTHLFIDSSILGSDMPSSLKKIKTDYPKLNVLVISCPNNIFLAQRMISHGVKALISKNSGIMELLECLSSIDIGRSYISADIRKLLNEHANILHPISFTDKEILILQFIVKGCTIIETANALKLSKHTIISHRRNIMDKTGINSATSLVKFAFDAGLVN